MKKCKIIEDVDWK